MITEGARTVRFVLATAVVLLPLAACRPASSFVDGGTAQGNVFGQPDAALKLGPFQLPACPSSGMVGNDGCQYTISAEGSELTVGDCTATSFAEPSDGGISSLLEAHYEAPDGFHDFRLRVQSTQGHWSELVGMPLRTGDSPPINIGVVLQFSRADGPVTFKYPGTDDESYVKLTGILSARANDVIDEDGELRIDATSPVCYDVRRSQTRFEVHGELDLANSGLLGPQRDGKREAPMAIHVAF